MVRIKPDVKMSRAERKHFKLSIEARKQRKKALRRASIAKEKKARGMKK